MAWLLRTTEGIVVKNTLINREILIRHLQSNPNLNNLKIHQLMNPADAQDVPRAIELLTAIQGISKTIPDQYSSMEQHEIAIISVIGDMFAAFLEAFTNVDLDLLDQMVSLSTYAHMCFTLFCRYQVNFTPNQLYIDSQTSTNNAIFCVAK